MRTITQNDTEWRVLLNCASDRPLFETSSLNTEKVQSSTTKQDIAQFLQQKKGNFASIQIFNIYIYIYIYI